MHALDLSTAHLRLRLLDAGDRALHASLYTSPRVMARIAPALDASAAARAFDASVAHNARSAPGHRTWAVSEADGARDIGIGALHRDGDAADVGIMLLPGAWNGRYSVEVLDALVGCGFADLGLQRLFAVCRLGPNERMAHRLLAPQGFRPTAAQRPGTARWLLERPAAP